MKTLYFLEPGQKLNDIKPSERKRALLITNQEWNKFGDHLVRNQKKLEAAEREKEEMEYRTAQSKEMAKTWENTIINMRRQRIENRRRQIAQLEKDRRKRFLEMRKEEADNKRQIIQEAQQILRRDKDNAKSLISALKFSECLREREEQVKFQNKLKEIEEAKEREYAARIWSDAEKYKDELKKEKEDEEEKKRKFNRQARTEMADFVKRRQEEEEIERLLDIEDNRRVLQEMATIAENERKEKERKKNIVLQDIKENRQLIAEHEAQLKREEEEEEAAIHIHAETKKRIAKIKKKREKDEAVANQIRREEISKTVAVEEADKEAEENRIICKAVAEKEARELELIEKKEAYQKQLVQQLREERENQLRSEQEEKIREKELLKLSLMQRMANNKVNAEFNERMREMKRASIKNNRALWDKQCEELRETNAANRKADIDAVARSVNCWNLEDKIFLEYADTILEESKQLNRPLLPINKYIEQFKKEVGLTAKPKLHKTWISRVPINNQLIECPNVRRQFDY